MAPTNAGPGRSREGLLRGTSTDEDASPPTDLETYLALLRDTRPLLEDQR